MYEEESSVLHREVLPPRTASGIFGPLAAITTVMTMTIASVAIMALPPAEQAQIRRAHVWIDTAPRPAEIRSTPYLRPTPDVCRGPVYRPGPDGRTEMVYEICAAAPLPRFIRHD